MDFDTEPFARHGFQIFRGVVGADRIAKVRSRLETGLACALDMMTPFGIRPDIEFAGGDIRRLLTSQEAPNIDFDVRVTMTGGFPLNVRLDPTLLEIPGDENVQAILKSALGVTGLRMHMPPMARFILPGNLDAGVPAHQDVSYNRHMSNFLTLWAPLVDIDDACGGVTVFKRSDGAEHPTHLASLGVWNEELETHDLEAVNCTPMAPGDVLIFNKLLVQRSMPNHSERIRLSIDYRFFGDRDSSTKPYLDMTSGQVVSPNQMGSMSVND